MSVLELKILPDLVLLATAAAMWISARLTPPLAALPLAARLIAGGMLVLCGLAVVQAAGAEFRRLNTSTDPLRPGSASALATGGVYRISRNPMYLGMAIVLLGWGVFLINLLSIGLVSVFILMIDRFQIVPEERVLSGRFGEAYSLYRRRVRRWL